MTHKRKRCVFCGSEEIKRGTYLTFKGYSSTMQVKFHAICSRCSVKMHGALAILITNFDKAILLIETLKEREK